MYISSCVNNIHSGIITEYYCYLSGWLQTLKAIASEQSVNSRKDYSYFQVNQNQKFVRSIFALLSERRSLLLR